MKDNRNASDLRVGIAARWKGDEVVYGRPLIHVGLHQRSRTKRTEANFCARCERPIRTGEPKVNVLGYAAAHFHAVCFAEWAVQAAQEAGEDVSQFSSTAAVVPLLRALRWIERYAQCVEQAGGKSSPETPPEQKLADVAHAIGVWAGNALSGEETEDPLVTLLTAAQAARLALDPEVALLERGYWAPNSDTSEALALLEPAIRQAREVMGKGVGDD